MIDIRQKLDEIGPFVPGADDGLLVCRCEEVTKGEIRKAVHEGIFTIEEMRRYLRNGMGLCQGQTCSRLVKSIMAAARALDADLYASFSDGHHTVSFDRVVEVMRQTGHDLPSLYKETSEGGLAKGFPRDI